MHASKWIISFLIVFISILGMIFTININYDVYGVYSKEDKFTKYTTDNNHIRILDKLAQDDDLYLVGTSRVIRVDPVLVEEYSAKKCSNVNISGGSFYENLHITKEIKYRGKDLIYGFDAFSINNSRAQLDRLDEFIDTQSNYTFEHYKQYFTATYLNKTIESFLYTQVNKEKTFNFIEENNVKNMRPIVKNIDKKVAINSFKSGKVYSDYEAVSNENILLLSKILTKEDIVIIYPKYFEYYKFFQKNQNIEEQYFNAVRYLVHNTKAKVYSFYGINSITTDHNNFDKGGWHFKPKISKTIFDCIYKNMCTDNTGIELTKNNVDSILKKTSSDIAQFTK